MTSLLDNHISQDQKHTIKGNAYERITLAISYIRSNYMQKITLSDVARAVLCDKYTLCKDFKKLRDKPFLKILTVTDA